MKKTTSLKKLFPIVSLAIFSVGFFLYGNNTSAIRLSQADVYEEALDVGMYKCSSGASKINIPLNVGNSLATHEITCDQLLEMRGKNRYELGQYFYLKNYNRYRKPILQWVYLPMNTFRGALSPSYLDYATFFYYLKNAMAKFPDLKVTKCQDTKPSSGMYFANKIVKAPDKFQWCTVEFKGSDSAKRSFNSYMSENKYYWPGTLLLDLPADYQSNSRYKVTEYSGPYGPVENSNEAQAAFTIMYRREKIHTFSTVVSLNQIFSEVEKESFYGSCRTMTVLGDGGASSENYCVRLMQPEDYANYDWPVDNSGSSNGNGNNNSDNDGEDNQDGNEVIDDGTISCTCANGQTGKQVETALLSSTCECGNGESVKSVVEFATDIMSAAVGVLGVTGFSIVGVQYMTAGGDELKMRKAKRRMFEVVIGLVAYALIYSVIKWLMP